MVRTLLFTFCILVCSFVFSQQDPQFSQYLFNYSAINPGYVGSNDQYRATAVHRTQWMGFDGAPTTLNLNVEGAVPGIHGGLGLNIISDKIGYNEFLGLSFSYAYRKEVLSGVLGAGLSLGLLQDAIGGGEWIAPNGVSGDPSIPQMGDKASGFDMGLGAYYNTNNIFFGLSMTHVNQVTIASSSKLIQMKRHYYITAGYSYDIDEMLSLRPMLFIKSDGVTSQLDFSALVLYNNKFWGGVNYRPEDAIVTMLGLNVNESLHFGFAYDIPISQIAKSSLEFMVGYNFDISLDRIPKAFKNPRFL